MTALRISAIRVLAVLVSLCILAGLYWLFITKRNSEKIPARGVFVLECREGLKIY